MTVMITIPDRTGALSTGQVAEMLNMAIDEANSFLRKHHAEQPFSLEKYRQDQRVLERLIA